jgi:hypothetical protein
VRAILGAVAAVSVVFSASAYAQYEDPDGRAARLDELDKVKDLQSRARSNWSDPGVRASDNRHRGFFFRPDLGAGYMTLSGGSPLGDLTISGPAGFFGLHAGGAIAEDLILAVHLYDGAIADPKASVAGQSATLSGATVAMVALGPELTWYLMPANVYLSATVALTKVTLEVNGSSADTQAGFGAQLGIGKEWWVSSHWGLGLVGHASFSSNKDQGTNASTISTLGFGLAFSATYN